MLDITTISTKGQITIPSQIREQADLRAGDKVRFMIDDHGSVVLFPIRGSIRDAFGVLPKPKRALSIEEMNEAVQGAIADSVISNARD